MADLSLNYYLMQGTNAARIAQTPDPAAPGAGPELLPIWWETDTGDTYVWDTSGAGAWAKIATSGATGTVTSVDVDGGTTGLTTSGGPVTTTGTITLGGTLTIANGGTGETSANDAINALLPPQATHAGKFLQSDGTDTSWVAGGTGTVTSVGVSSTDLSVGGSPVTTSGSITLDLNTTAVTPGSYTYADITVDSKGRITAAASGTKPFDVTAFYPGVPTASAIVLRVPVARSITFPDDFSGSYGVASAAATASTAFDIQKNGSSVGTATFGAAASTATFVTAAGALSLAAGDVLAIIAPASPDATLANPGFVLAATR